MIDPGDRVVASLPLYVLELQEREEQTGKITQAWVLSPAGGPLNPKPLQTPPPPPQKTKPSDLPERCVLAHVRGEHWPSLSAGSIPCLCSIPMRAGHIPRTAENLAVVPFLRSSKSISMACRTMGSLAKHAMEKASKMSYLDLENLPLYKGSM